jgi:hypothetical protein
VTGTATLERLTLDASNGALFADGGFVSIEDIEARQGGTLFGRDGRAAVRGLRVAGAVGDRAVVAGSFLSLEIAGLVVVDSELPGVLSVDGPSGLFRLSDLHVEASTLRQPAVWVRGPSVDVSSSVFVCVQSQAPVLVADRGEVRGVIVWNWHSDQKRLFDVAHVSSATFLTIGAAPGDLVFRSDVIERISDAFFAGSMAMSAAPARTSRIRHIAGTARPLDVSVEVDPQFWGEAKVDSCDGLTLFPDRGSPLLDVGNPDVRDRDGSPSDIGAGGGPDGVDLVPDEDQDRCPATHDCNDQNASQRPGTREIWYDGVDGDCDGSDDFDQDRDGFVFGAAQDCDDLRADVRPDAPDPCGDAVDADCDGFDGSDCDQDGYASMEQGGEDCDDENPDVFPGADEDIGEVDRDCDGVRDPLTSVEPITCTASPEGARAAWWVLGLAVLGVGAAARRRFLPGPA